MKITRIFGAKLTLLSDSKLCLGCKYINYVSKDDRIYRFAYIDGNSKIDVSILETAIRQNLAVDLLIERKPCPQKDNKEIDYLITGTLSTAK